MLRPYRSKCGVPLGFVLARSKSARCQEATLANTYCENGSADATCRCNRAGAKGGRIVGYCGGRLLIVCAAYYGGDYDQ